MDLRCQQRARLLENKLSFDRRPQSVTGQVGYQGIYLCFAARPNPMVWGGGVGHGPIQSTPIGSFTKVIASPTDRLREQTRSGQLKAPVHRRLHRPKWHTMKQLKHRVVRPSHPIPAGLSESALTCDNDHRGDPRGDARCAAPAGVPRQLREPPDSPQPMPFRDFLPALEV